MTSILEQQEEVVQARSEPGTSQNTQEKGRQQADNVPPYGSELANEDRDLFATALEVDGHVIRKENESITKTALLDTRRKAQAWQAQESWRRTVETDEGLNQSWNTIQQLAKDRQQWRTLLLPYVPVGTMGSE
ncbi:hypothetical protein ACROYT_G029865 [Oculina patagonica]